ncbi:putative E3 ubiquitin-protein ligase [Cladophialophora chaetospira]|uniref:HECT-type E3 ubiquitin transferase n=1 Tax=Cladophialophora chaetospira TaxID=386627 RepID=A0AA38XID2_9EURO|nr:putative E3 ubiquitin-protein ligase [Cladophialophora chaetospira]
MASMPSSAPHNHRSNRPRPRNIQLTRSTSHDQPTSAADVNRPLPPPPATAAAETYDIPSLRRKPVPEESPDSRPGNLNHSRSFSHPFPAIFGSKKTEKKTRHGGEFDGTRDARHEEVNSRNPTGESSLPRGDRQPVTGRCMTCDSTVRWPQGLKVFRCTTCLTINDLEYNPEMRADAPGPAPGPVPPRKLVPLSLDRTRALLERCLRQYFDSRIEQDEPSTPARALAVENEQSADDSFLLDGTPPEGVLYGQLNDEQDSPPPSPLPRANPRSPSEESTLSTNHPHRNGGPAFVQGHSTDPFLSSTSRPIRPQDLRGRQISETGANLTTTPEPKSDIFRLVENYIGSCFVGCATLNGSFLTPRPHQEPVPKPRSNSGTQQRRQISEPVSTPNFEPDAFLSELDAKTLLLGDVAENGSWWLGAPSGRIPTGKESNHQRDRSPDKSRSFAPARHPRINWPELIEWYRLIIYAGDHWEKGWHELQHRLSDSRAQQCWRSVPLESIQRDIIESRIHLHRSLLKVSENLLKRPRQPLKHPDDCRFLLMLLANPLLTPARLEAGKFAGTTMSYPPIPVGKPQADDRFRDSPSKRVISANRRPGSLGHHSGIIKRILGLIANLSNENHQYLVVWFSRFADGHFQRTVEMVSSFVTYRLSRQQKQPANEPINPTAGLVPSFSDSGMHHASQVHAALGGRPTSTSAGKSAEKPRLSVYGEDWQVRVAARVMALLFQANVGHIARKRDASAAHEQRLQSPGLNAKYRAYSHGQIVPINNFYNTMLDYADLVSDFETWEHTKTKFTFCQYPFFLSIYAKIHILEHDAKRQMEVKAKEAFFDSILSRRAVSQFLILKIRRDCLVEDSLRGVSEVVGSGGSDIKKGLRIDFQGEEGVDAGGLRKEWFLLLTREIFDPHHGLFVYDDDSQYCYFNPFCFESSEQFFLVGVLLGLAIYNSTILDVAFPPFVFKKMLASAPSTGDKLTSTPKVGHGYTLEDLAEFRPALAKGFRQLLEFEGDVEETFCRDFVAEMDRYGEIVQVPLCSGGEKRSVNNSNRREFVDLYVHYLLDTAVARQYEPFKRGFFTVCGGNALSLFRPEEIELLVRGSDEPLDIASLRAVAAYEGWPKEEGSPEHQAQVVWFWDFFARVAPPDQRKILSFITASDRIPAMGATNLVIRIQLIRDKEEFDMSGRPTNKPTERFPIARTCFNTLSLYRYASRQKLEEKLWMAVQCSEGFGLK